LTILPPKSEDKEKHIPKTIHRKPAPCQKTHANEKTKTKRLTTKKNNNNSNNKTTAEKGRLQFFLL